MRSLTLLVLLALNAPVDAIAQQITVRSGAHEGFARLVMRLPNGKEWVARSDPSGVRIEIDGHTGGFDTSRVFELIDRSFIADLSVQGDAIDVRFGCDCVAETYVEPTGFLVIDVRNSETAISRTAAANKLAGINAQRAEHFRFPYTSPRAQRVAVQEPADARPEPEEPGTVAPETTAIDANENPLDSVMPDAATPTEEKHTLPDTIAVDEDTIAPLEPKSAEQLAIAQQKLAERVGTAATQGILDPAQAIIDLPLTEDKPTIDTSIFDSSEPSEIPSENAPVSGNLRITSSADLPGTSLPVGIESTSMGFRCISPDNVAVQDWGTDKPPMAQIAEYRGQLYSELDRLNEDIAIRLAKLYLHFGFGAEARQLLDIDTELADSHPALLEIADILEFGHARDGTYLANFTDCGSDVALWAVLADQELDPSTIVDASAALRAGTSLPLHLRSYIAPLLSRRLLAYGDEASAATALRSLERTPDPLPANANLARADLMMSEGKTEEAQDVLAGVIASNEQQSAEALIKFVDSHLEADTLIDESVATLVEAYAIEMRDDPLGVELKRTHALALAKSAQFDAAFDALEGMGDQHDDGTAKQALRGALLGILTKTAEDLVFLEHVFHHARENRRLKDAKISIGLAARLAELGFPQMAEDFLSAEDSLPNTSDVRVLRAQIALATGRPLQAESFVFGLTSAQADRIRADAKTMYRDFDDAHALYAALGDQKQSLRSAWLGQDWDDLQDAGEGPFADMAQVINRPVQLSDEVDGMISRLTDAVEESAQARGAIESLLNTPVDPFNNP